jgi:CubicO group peptidase (beta-lactamase class C family)
LAQKPLQFEPRASYQYSLGHDVLAAVIEVITQERFSDYLKENIADPLGMKDFHFHTNPGIQERIAQQYCFDPESGVFEPVSDGNHLLFSHNYDSGGAGLITRVSDYVLLADALANGGVGVTGKQLLKPETIDDMRTNRLEKKQMQAFWRLAKYGYGYGLGVRTLICPSVSEGPVGEFGWDGAAGAYFLSDPQNHIAIFYGQHILNYSDIYTVVHPAIRDMVYRACK